VVTVDLVNAGCLATTLEPVIESTSVSVVPASERNVSVPTARIWGFCWRKSRCPGMSVMTWASTGSAASAVATSTPIRRYFVRESLMVVVSF